MKQFFKNQSKTKAFQPKIQSKMKFSVSTRFIYFSHNLSYKFSVDLPTFYISHHGRVKVRLFQSFSEINQSLFGFKIGDALNSEQALKYQSLLGTLYPHFRYGLTSHTRVG